MFRPTVNTLYKYVPINEFSLRILSDNAVWCSKPSGFNDPFDSQYNVATIEKGLTQDHFLRLFQEVYGLSKAKQRAALTHLFLPDGTIRKTIKKRILQRVAKLEQCADMGVFCLTEVSSSILMWSHYAKEHTGMCVGFERDKDNALGNDGICLPVTYSRNYLTVDTMRIFLKKDFSPVEDMMRTKFCHWEYEKEWRLFSQFGNAEAEAPGKIRTVILGCRTSTRSRNRVMKALNGKPVKLYRSLPVTGKFELKMEAI
jgi:hypothetical protein